MWEQSSRACLSYASHEVRSTDPVKRADFRKYLTNSIIQLWHVFERELQDQSGIKPTLSTCLRLTSAITC